jgi:magnesium transporter
MITYLKNIRGYKIIDQWEPNCWINVECPTEEEIALLSARFNIPQEFTTDIADIDERPRTEVDDDWQYLIIRVPHFSDNGAPYITAPLGIFFANEVILTICYYQTQMLSDFVNHTQRKNINIQNNFDFVMRLILSSSIWFLKYLKQINNLIYEAEKELERSIKNEELQSLMKIGKSLVYFITSLRGNGILFSRIKNLKFSKDFFDEDLYEDADIELRQAIETANIHSDILDSMMENYASVISNNLNAVMKQLTAISIILMIPTLIASIFGMNLNSHLENNDQAFLWVILGSFLISIVGVLLLRRRDWF